MEPGPPHLPPTPHFQHLTWSPICWSIKIASTSTHQTYNLPCICIHPLLLSPVMKKIYSSINESPTCLPIPNVSAFSGVGLPLIDYSLSIIWPLTLDFSISTENLHNSMSKQQTRTLLTIISSSINHFIYIPPSTENLRNKQRSPCQWPPLPLTPQVAATSVTQKPSLSTMTSLLLNATGCYWSLS